MTKFPRYCLLAASFLGLPLATATVHAKEFGFLENDSRFTGGEFNVNSPTQQNFWFWDQYGPARERLMADGVVLNPVHTITKNHLEWGDGTPWGSEGFYMPGVTDPSATTYPLSDSELGELKGFVADGWNVIFQLGANPKPTNDLIGRLGLSGHQATGAVSGSSAYPDPSSPVIGGAKGEVGSYSVDNSGWFDQLGSLRSLQTVQGHTTMAYVEKGDLGQKWGGFFFVLDEGLVRDYASNSAFEQNLFRNLTDYSMQDQYLHYIPPPTLPEPTALTVLAGGALGFVARRRRACMPAAVS